MPEPKDLVLTYKFKGYSNIKCEFFPCHKGIKQEFSCLFCYCPLINYECPGPYKLYKDRRGNNRKDCSDCKLPHDGYEKSWSFIQKWLENPITWDKTEQSVEKLKRVNKLRNGSNLQ